VEDLQADVLRERRGQRDIACRRIDRERLVELQILGRERAVVLLFKPVDRSAVDDKLIQIGHCGNPFQQSRRSAAHQSHCLNPSTRLSADLFSRVLAFWAEVG